MTKQNQWRKANKQSVYRDSGVMEAMVKLYGPTSPAGCAVCGNDDRDNLGIHPHDCHEKEWRTLCDQCYGATKQSFDNGLQKQIGGSHV